jgi:hypothetical protein
MGVWRRLFLSLDEGDNDDEDEADELRATDEIRMKDSLSFSKTLFMNFPHVCQALPGTLSPWPFSAAAILLSSTFARVLSYCLIPVTKQQLS